MKFLIICLLLITAHSLNAQSMLDQDPAQRALSESIFDHPPASSVAGPTPAPNISNGTQGVRLDVQIESTRGSVGRHHGDEGHATGYSIAIHAGTLSKTPIVGTMDVLFTRMRYGKISPGKRVGFPISIRAMGAMDVEESCDGGLAYGQGWIVRVFDDKGNILGSAGSTAELSEIASDSNRFNQLFSNAQFSKKRD